MKRFPVRRGRNRDGVHRHRRRTGSEGGHHGATKAHAPTTGATSARRAALRRRRVRVRRDRPSPRLPDRARRTTTTGASKGQGKSAKTTSTSTTTTSTSESTGTSTSTGTTAVADVAPPNPVSMKIDKNPAQLARAMDFLTPLGLTLEEGTAGFRNQGQFIAAMNAAKNRSISISWPAGSDDGRRAQPRSGREEGGRTPRRRRRRRRVTPGDRTARARAARVRARPEPAARVRARRALARPVRAPERRSSGRPFVTHRVPPPSDWSLRRLRSLIPGVGIRARQRATEGTQRRQPQPPRRRRPRGDVASDDRRRCRRRSRSSVSSVVA